MITFGGTYVGRGEGCPTTMDIAVQAGRLTRYAGAVWQPLLSHLVLVGLLLFRYSRDSRYASEDFATAHLLAGLVHDGHEAVTGDTPAPLKCDCVREVQRRLDRELYPRYLGPLEAELDHAFMKRVDLLAGDLEATELGLPNYRETSVRLARLHRGHGLEEFPEPSRADRELCRRVLGSMFQIGTTAGTGSNGVLALALALGQAEQGDRSGARDTVLSWGLL